MDKRRVGQIKERFDLVIHSDQEVGVEFWYARDLMSLLGYERWENFAKAIVRAIDLTARCAPLPTIIIFVTSRK